MSNKITLEMLEERLKLYKTELQQLHSMIKIYEGAVQDCEYWTTQLKRENNDN